MREALRPIALTTDRPGGSRRAGFVWALGVVCLAMACDGDARPRGAPAQAARADAAADGAADSAAVRLEPLPLPPRDWRVAARRDEGVFLAAPALTHADLREAARRSRTGHAPPPPELLQLTERALHHAARGGAPMDSPVAVVGSVTLRGADSAGARPVWVARTGSEFGRLLVDVPGATPRLLPFPGDRGRWIFEEAGRLWMLDAAGTEPFGALVAEPLVVDRVGPYDRSELSARQREGESILYWAAAPEVEPGGSRIAFASNREAMLAGEAGQSVWVLDTSDWLERPIVHVPGESWRPTGWLGGRVVVIGSRPGVWLADPTARDAPLARISTGTLIAAAPDGSAVAVLEDEALRLLPRGATGPDADRAPLVVPAPTDGRAWAPQASFSPGGVRLLAQRVSADGTDRAWYVVDVAAGRAAPLRTPFPTDRWPEWFADDTLLVSAEGRGRAEGAERAGRDGTATGSAGTAQDPRAALVPAP